VKPITRRELFKEMVSKDTIRQFVGAWYGFSKPLQQQPAAPKKESLFERVKNINMKHSKPIINQNGKEG